MQVSEGIRLIESGLQEKIPNSIWADLGCGSGLFTKALATLLGNGSTIYAVDKSQQSIESSFNNVAIEFIKADLADEPLPFVNLDGVLMANSLHYIKDKSTFLEKVKRLLKPNGHQLLLQAGDSTSRILPIKQISKGIFQIEFQNRFSFVPDTLVRIVKTNLALANLPINYLVKVLDCSSNEMVYGFEINSIQNNIVPCLGRAQPLACYKIQIAFVAFVTRSGKQYYFYFLGAMGIAVALFVGLRYMRIRRISPTSKNSGVKIGMYSFLVSSRLLRCGDETIELSLKESKLLGILAEQPNELITRDRLLKEVWEDDGVFTRRSLDVFISKLRKKLKNDPTIQLTNTHGLGYTLEIRND